MVPPEPPTPGFRIVSISPSLPASIEDSKQLIVTFNEDVYEHFITLHEKLYINGIANYEMNEVIGWDFPDVPGSPLFEAVPEEGTMVLYIAPPPGDVVPVKSVSLSPT